MLPFITPVFADATTQATTPSVVGNVVLLVGFVLIFWLLIWRPQSKRAKEHKTLLSSLAKGDEVVTSGGILGKVVHTSDDFVTLQVSEEMQLNFQKASVVSTLPKGTIKSIK